jgi:predicted transposase YdaD
MRTEARREGLAEVRQEGREEGRQEGRTEEAQKSYQEKLEIARNLKKAGVSSQIIAENFKLPLTIIESL